MTLKNLFCLMMASIFCIALLSCKKDKKAVIQENMIQFDSLIIKKQKHLFNDTSKANATIELKLLVPDSTTQKKLLPSLDRNLKATLFGQGNSAKTIKELADNYVSGYLKEYSQLEAVYLKDQSEFKNRKGEREEDVYEPMESSYTYQHSTSMEITYNKANMLSYVIHRYDYTGGAHGMNTDSCYTIMLKKGSILKQEDLFNENALDKVAALIVSHITEDNNVKEPEELEEIGFFSVKEIYPNGNMYIDERGITWSYNPYDIAAYAIGTIKVTVPFSELKPLLKPTHPLTAFVKE